MLKEITISRDKQNKWERTFEEMLNLMECSFVRYGKGYYGLYDEQGANLGNINDDTFTDASSIIDRLDMYIHDYIIRDIEEELENYEINCPTDEQILNGEPPFRLTDCEWYYRLLTLLPQSDASQGIEFIVNHKFDYEALDMILHHSDEINLENISYIETDKKLRMITVTETYSKSFVVLADSSEEAQEIVNSKWNNGELGEMEGENYIPDSFQISDDTDAWTDIPIDFFDVIKQNEN